MKLLKETKSKTPIQTTTKIKEYINKLGIDEVNVEDLKKRMKKNLRNHLS